MLGLAAAIFGTPFALGAARPVAGLLAKGGTKGLGAAVGALGPVRTAGLATAGAGYGVMKAARSNFAADYHIGVYGDSEDSLNSLQAMRTAGTLAGGAMMLGGAGTAILGRVPGSRLAAGAVVGTARAAGRGLEGAANIVGGFGQMAYGGALVGTGRALSAMARGARTAKNNFGQIIKPNYFEGVRQSPFPWGVGSVIRKPVLGPRTNPYEFLPSSGARPIPTATLGYQKLPPAPFRKVMSGDLGRNRPEIMGEKLSAYGTKTFRAGVERAGARPYLLGQPLFLTVAPAYGGASRKAPSWLMGTAVPKAREMAWKANRKLGGVVSYRGLGTAFGAVGVGGVAGSYAGIETSSSRFGNEGNIRAINSAPRGGISPELQFSTQGLTLKLHNASRR